MFRLLGLTLGLYGHLSIIMVLLCPFPPGLLHCGRGIKRRWYTGPQLRAHYMAGVTKGYKQAGMETEGEFSIILPATCYLLNTVTSSMGSKQLHSQCRLHRNGGAFTQAVEWGMAFHA